MVEAEKRSGEGNWKFFRHFRCLPYALVYIFELLWAQAVEKRLGDADLSGGKLPMIRAISLATPAVSVVSSRQSGMGSAVPRGSLQGSHDRSMWTVRSSCVELTATEPSATD